jgi:plasmid stabilization system protein ParE
MASLYDVSAEAQTDLYEIWRRIAGDSVTSADRIESEFYELFESLGRMPGQGHTRCAEFSSKRNRRDKRLLFDIHVKLGHNVEWHG